MRILRFFIFSALSILVLSSIVFFAGREILLVIGASMLKADYNALVNKNYAEECIRQFDYGQENWPQIRFISNKEYNLEVVCADFTESPIILSSKKLPPLLFKESFGSGFMMKDEELPFFVELKALGRKIIVYTDGGKINSNYLFKPDLDYNQGPLSSCQSRGYQCCSLDLQSGLGEQTTLVNDCPKSCYQSCLLRPVVLSFNARPALDDATRTVEVNSGEAVTFSYVLGNGKDDVFKGQLAKDGTESFMEKLQTLFSKSKTQSTESGIALPLAVSVDFGDGELFDGANLQDTFDHIYNCPNSVCYYQVKLNAKDGRGVLSVDNELAKMIVKVNR